MEGLGKGDASIQIPILRTIHMVYYKVDLTRCNILVIK